MKRPPPAAAPSPSTGPAPQRIPWQLKFVLLALIWGSSFLLMKFGLLALAPVQIAAIRIWSGALTVLVLLRLSGGRLPRGRRVWAHLTVAGFFLTALPFTCFALGETRVSSALAGIGNSFTPIAMVLVALVLIPAERVTRPKLFAIGLGFVGVLVISEFWAVQARPDPLGFGLTVAGGTCYGIGWPYLRRHLGHVDLGGLSQPAALLVAGSVLVLPMTLAWWWLTPQFAAPWSTLPAATPFDVWVAMLATLVLGAIGTGFAYTLQFDIVRAAGTVIGSTVTYVIPVVSVVLGVLVLGENLDAPQLAGFALVLTAALIIGRPAAGWRALLRRRRR
ncbi:DMT family transporter [Mobilicoccus massiliensis]|uniref:DMT family transporter n=1 Tax=Mobilicoccus massiliensis TaxID=1522310 RepID=UPI000693D8AD|nr:DMT family transporter [Mobilicoccus massiliensis]